ncbi:MAG: hypothetical protein ACRD0W_15325 [Acidimicrobiales bacterium]
MSRVDKRGRLADDPFEYRVTKNGQVFVSRGGRQVSTIAGARAARLIRDLENGDERARQLALAKATGNYRRGNERR